MNKYSWILAAIGAVAVLGIALGYSSPGSQIKELKANQIDHERRLSSHDVLLAKMDQKLDDLTDGMSELLGHKINGRK